tara:strand:- start:332 stop:721 length:390 start_codon:yes stop_codon:yes gene_type:complete
MFATTPAKKTTSKNNTILDRETISDYDFKYYKPTFELFKQIFNEVNTEPLDNMNMESLDEEIKVLMSRIPQKVSMDLLKHEIKLSCKSLVEKIKQQNKKTEMFNNKPCSNIFMDRPSYGRDTKELGSRM